jgi:Fuc2NAc and GlcNAc transferase
MFELPVSWTVTVAAALLTVAGVGALRMFALRSSMLDTPNARSSHTQATPRGGGAAILVVFVIGAAVIFARRQAASELFLTLVAGCFVGLVGWLDDRRSVSVRVRLAVHLMAGACMTFAGLRSGLPAYAALWWGFCAVAAINVVNFMDGIDGLIASQSFIFGLAVFLLAPAESDARELAALLVSTSAGFLVWNWPPARIFLGDVGSGFLGFAWLGVGLLAAERSGDSFLRVFLPLLPLCLDALVTLWRRQRNGERITEAHRSHLYQRLANGGWGHRRVTLVYALAAAIGALVALVFPIIAWPAYAAYVLAVLLVGSALDRLQPFHAAVRA